MILAPRGRPAYTLKVKLALAIGGLGAGMVGALSPALAAIPTAGFSPRAEASLLLAPKPEAAGSAPEPWWELPSGGPRSSARELPSGGDMSGNAHLELPSGGPRDITPASLKRASDPSNLAIKGVPPSSWPSGKSRNGELPSGGDMSGNAHRELPSGGDRGLLSLVDPRSRAPYLAWYVGASQVRIPNLALSAFLRSYSNALCRVTPGAGAKARGVNRSDRCNFDARVGLSRVRGRKGLDLELSYTRLAMPTSNWVAKNEEIAAADYLEVSLHSVAATVGAWREIPLSRQATRWSWRFGGQAGVALLLGSIYRTKLGAQPASCDFEDLGNPALCRPYRPLEFNEASRKTRAFADCTQDNGCDPRDLERAGRERVRALPPVLPWFSLWTGPSYAIDANTRLGARFSVGFGLGLGLSLERRIPAR